MDNLTHSLVGLAAAKAGLERLSPAATTLCIVTANAPDADIVVLVFGDRWSLLQHHRGITHALIGTAVLTFLIPLLFYGIDAGVAKLRGRRPTVNLKGLLIASAIVSVTHPLLDWTNNYGIRFFLPWRSNWSYGDLVFIVDPIIWLVFGTALFLVTSRSWKQKILWLMIATVTTLLVLWSPRRSDLPNPTLISAIWLGAMVTAVVLSFRGVGIRWGRRVAIAPLIFLVLYWSGLAFAHRMALKQATSEASTIAKQNDETVIKLAAMPTLANPSRWDCVFETDRAVYRFPISLAVRDSNASVVRYEKSAPGVEFAMQKLTGDRRVGLFLGFARFPVVQLSDPGCATRTLVQLADLRYTEPGNPRGSFSLEIPIECPSVLQSPDR